MYISQSLSAELNEQGLQLSEFTELILRLLDYSIICRDESQVEQALYDRYLRIDNLVNDFLSIMAIRVLHDRQFNYIRAFPPGAEIPGKDDETDQPFNSGLRSRLSQGEVALVLVLRSQYDKALREGKVDDDGGVTLSIEALAIAMRNLLQRSLPDNQTERRNLFKRLRQLRLVQFSQEDELQGEGWLRIRPQIVNYVSDEALAVLRGETSTEMNQDGPEEFPEPRSKINPSHVQSARDWPDKN